MSDIAEVSVKVTGDGSDFTEGLEKQFDTTAKKIESRGEKLTEKVLAGLNKVGQAAGSFKAITSVFKSEADKVEERSERMADKVRANIGKIGLGIVGGFALDSAIRQFDSLEARSAEVFTLLPQQGTRAFDALNQEILAFQGNIRVATEQAVPALYQAISAGQTEDPFGFLATARQASVGGITDLAVAVDALAGTVNAYDDVAVDAERVSDVLFTTVRLGVTTFGELAQALPNVTATAAAFGVSIEEAAAAVATLTQKGVDTQRATTFLNQALVELGKSGTTAQKQFEELTGGSLQDFLDQGNTFVDVVTLIAEASQNAGLSVIDMFGSVEAGRAILTLTNDGGEALAETFASVQASFGATEAAADKMSQTTTQTKERIGALIQTAQQSFGRQIQPLILDLLLAIEELLPTVVELADTFGGALRIGLQAVVPIIEVGVDVLDSLLKVINVLPSGLLAAVVAMRTFRNSFSVASTILTLARNTTIGTAAIGGMTTAMNTAAAASPRLVGGVLSAARAFSLAAAAAPTLGAALVAGVVLWNRYRDGQREAREEVEAYGKAVRERATPQVEVLAERVQGLIRDLELLDQSVEATEAKMAGLTEETAGLVGILDEAAQNDGLDEGFGARIRLAADDVNFLTLQAVELNEEFNRLNDSFNQGDSGRNRNVAFLEFLRSGADTGALRQFASDLIDVAVKAELTDKELETLVRSIATLGDGQSAFAQELEVGAIESLAEFKERGNDVVDSIVEQEIAAAKATGEFLPMTRAVAGVEAALSELEETEAGKAILEAADAQRTALDVFLASGGVIEDLADDYASLIGPLATVESLLDRVTSSLESQFRLGEAGRRAVQNLDAAYDDLGESLSEIGSESRLDDLRAQLADELDSTGSGIGQDVEDTADQIRERFRVAWEGVFNPDDPNVADDYVEVIGNIRSAANKAAQAALDEAQVEIDRERALDRLQQFGGFEQLERAVEQGIADELLKQIIDVPSQAAFAQIEREILRAGGIRAVEEAFGADSTSPGRDAADRQERQERIEELQAEIAAEEEALRARKDGLRALDDFTDSGRDAFDVITEYNNEVFRNAGVQLQMGESLSDVAAFLREQENLLFETAVAAGVSESALIEYQQTLDLTPEALQTLIGLVGADATIDDIQTVLQDLDAVPDEVKAQLLLLGADASLEEVLTVLDQLDLFGVTEEEARISIESGDALDTLAEINEQLLILNGYPVEIPFEITTTTTGAEGAAGVQGVVSSLGQQNPNVAITVSGDEEAIEDLTEVQIKIDEIIAIDPTVDVEALTTEAQTNLETLQEELDAINGRQVTADVIVNFTDNAGLPGFAHGGVFDRPGPGVPIRIGEDGREYAINTGNARHRNRSETLLARAAADLGMTVSRIGEGDGGTATATVSAAPGGVTKMLDVKVMKQDLDAASLARLLALDLDELFSL